MTDDHRELPQTAIDILAQSRAYGELCDTVRTGNKTALFDALSAAGITKVVVHFDGYGDSGQIEDIAAYAGDADAEIPSGAIEIAQPRWGEPETHHDSCSLRDAIEALSYDALEETHGGWENNEGAYGDFTFDVAARTITLDYNERYESSEYTQHIF